MDILKTDVRTIALKELKNNTGQIEGVPANPRVLRDDAYKALVASLQADNLTGVLPLKVIQYNGEWIALGGNMRLRALKEIGAKDVECIVVPQDTDANTLRKIVITDNSTFGEWDNDMLANEWSVEELQEWGVDVPSAPSVEEFGEEFELPSGDKPGFQQMTFVLADEQAERIKQAIEITKQSVVGEMFGNTNSNGNALYELVLEWESVKK